MPCTIRDSELVRGLPFGRIRAILNHLKKRIRINNQIRTSEVRLIDPEGKNLGIIKIEDALEKAKGASLDLIEIAPTAKPPVAKIMDYGKYRYDEERKDRQAKKTHQPEVRAIRVRLGTSEHDLEMKAKKASEFLGRGDRIRIELVLRGRQKYLDRTFILERLNRILSFITQDHKIAEGPKRGPRGPYLLIEKAK